MYEVTFFYELKASSIQEINEVDGVHRNIKENFYERIGTICKRARRDFVFRAIQVFRAQRNIV